MNKNGRLYFTIGLPRNGKSFVCNLWVKERSDRPRIIVCADDFRLALTGQRYVSWAEGTVFAMVDVATRALLLRGHDVILDETSTSKSSLYRIFNLDIDAKHILIDTPPEVCIERTYTTGQSDLVPVIHRINVQLREMKCRGIELTLDTIRTDIINKRRLTVGGNINR